MRLFIALWPDDEVRRQLAAAQAAWGWRSRAVRVPPERLHLTLHFLGEVSEPVAEALRERLPPSGLACELCLDRPSLWPHGIAVLEAGTVPPALAELHGELALRLQALGLRTEGRAFRPHVTLARHAQGSRPPSGFESIRWAVSGYALVHSRSGPPLHYELLQQVGV
ncbi:RNA 2',3'-cyclic phosphodiesterase [uncultured Piscinibacter sp.]|uniref:RNA 2',3'-cyclic phosphodiesterase n=1 Tax=uncultured Piscinibacter sp. TaxID=1131835 RepID=UPI00263534F0|nr:RNA 2',3'-cyclic phosphodiesterase [uncultured Piscinibacter sp.]